MSRSTCVTGWVHHGGCQSRAVASAVPRSSMFFTLCKPETADGQWELMVSSFDQKAPHSDLFRSEAAAKRAAGNYIRGFRRSR